MTGKVKCTLNLPKSCRFIRIDPGDAHGATQEAVNNDDLAGVHIIIPEDTVLRAYHEIK